jgi:23S rRNA pseudouridine1911/1915/1917 synthase
MSDPLPPSTELITIRLLVLPQYDGWRLDHFVKAIIPRLSRSRIQKMIVSQMDLAGLAYKPSTRVFANQEITLFRPAPVEPEVPRSFSVLYQDDHLMAIDKPAGLPVHATARFHKNTLTYLLRETFAEGSVPTLAHRLDRETSGLLILGRSTRATTNLKESFRHRRVSKRYLAIVKGRCPEQGVIDLPLGPDLESGIRIKMAAVPSGLPSKTRYRALGHRGDFSLVEVAPETGRQHQIRAHLTAIGHPVLGDKLYGQDPSVWLEYIENGMTPSLIERLVLPRHALHAHAIALPHPEGGQIIHLLCPLASDLELFWNSL